MAFANAAAFSNPDSHRLAMGMDLNPNTAIVDPQGNVLAHAQTGGIMNPERHELCFGQKIFRFGGSGRPPTQVAAGCWWVSVAEFDKMLAFANVHGLGIGMAMRCLCLVPPEWSDAGTLVRARVVRDLLAWRGLGNSVVTPTRDGGTVRLPHQNEIAARRCHQLYVPGLNIPGMAESCLAIEASYSIDPKESLQGFLYL